MHQNTFDFMISNLQNFAKEIFSPNSEEIFQIKLMDTLEEIMKMGKHLKLKRLPMVEHFEAQPSKKPKLNQSPRILDFPNEIWVKIIKHLPGKIVYGNLTLVSKRFQSLALHSGVLRTVNISLLEDDELEFLENSKVPIEIVWKNSFYQDILRAISVTKNLKSAVLENHSWGTYDDGGMGNVQKGDYVYMDFVEALKEYKCKLEHLSLTGYYAEPEVMVEISKIKTLKTLRISDARRVVVTPEVVNAFAQNENQLENIEFDDTNDEYYDPFFNGNIDEDEFCDELNIALNNLLDMKSDSLKSLKHITWCKSYESSVSLTNLILCQNLKEFCGQLEMHDVKILSKLPRLQKVRLTDLDKPKYLLSHLNLSYLRYLYLEGSDDKATKIICQEVPKHHFPVLERLFIHSPPKLNETLFSNLISNTPKLKSIQLYRSKCPVSHEFMYNFCKDSNIFVSFNSKRFEKFLVEKDMIVFGEYIRKKHAFKKWCSENPDYCKRK